MLPPPREGSQRGSKSSKEGKKHVWFAMSAPSGVRGRARLAGGLGWARLRSEMVNVSNAGPCPRCPGVPAVPPSRCHHCGMCRPPVWEHQLLGGGWGHWVLQAGGPESSSSPSLCRCRRVPSPALGLIVRLPGLLRLPFWYVFPKSHLCPSKQPSWYACVPQGTHALPTGQFAAPCTCHMFTPASVPSGQGPGLIGW